MRISSNSVVKWRPHFEGQCCELFILSKLTLPLACQREAISMLHPKALKIFAKNRLKIALAKFIVRI